MGACGDCHVQVCAYSHMKEMMTDPSAVPAGEWRGNFYLQSGE